MGAGEWWRCGWAQDLMLEMRTSRSVDCARTSCRGLDVSAHEVEAAPVDYAAVQLAGGAAFGGEVEAVGCGAGGPGSWLEPSFLAGCCQVFVHRHLGAVALGSAIDSRSVTPVARASRIPMKAAEVAALRMW